MVIRNVLFSIMAAEISLLRKCLYSFRVITIKHLLTVPLLLMMSAFVFGQEEQPSAYSPLKNHIYDVDWTVASPDMNYFTFQKSYDYSQDTLALISPKQPEKILFQTGDVMPSSVKFSKKGHVFMSGISSAKLLRLPDLKPIIWNGIDEGFFMQGYNKVAILKKETLSVYSEDGVLEDEIKNIIKLEEKDQRIFYTQKNGEQTILIEWAPQGKHTLFSVPSTSYHISLIDDRNFIIQTSKTGEKVPQIFFVDALSKEKVKLVNESLVMLQTLAGASKLQDGRYFLTMNVNVPVAKKTSDVDIWYANDNRLEKKFLPKSVLQYMIWNPINGEVEILDHRRFDKQSDPGNGRYLMAFDSFLNQDYVKERNESEMYRYDTQTGKYDYLGITGLYKTYDKEGKYLLSHDTRTWVLYNIGTKKKEVITLERTINPFFSSSGDRIIFPGSGFVGVYDIASAELKRIPVADKEEAVIVTGISDGVGFDSFSSKSYYDDQKPLLLKVKDSEKLTESYFTYQHSKLQPLTKPSGFRLTEPMIMADGKTFLYLKENFNIPPSFVLNSKGREKLIYKTNPRDLSISEYKLVRISYSNAKGVPLTGLLYYPRQFDKNKKYPMVVGIYETMNHHISRYLKDGFKGLQTEGLNIRHYLDEGYFILLPDIVYDERGPGRSALDCVEASLTALEGNGSIDFQKVGLLGHSHGGYQTNFIATQSKKFAAYVGGAGNADLVRSYNSFHYDRARPFYWQFEEQQYRIFKPFSEAKELYIDNSPIYHAEKVNSPILLWTGTKDENIEWEQSMEFYLGLRRNHKKVIALFYEGEEHSLQKIKNREDLFIRVSEWFDYHLKGKNNDWIEVMNKPTL